MATVDLPWSFFVPNVVFWGSSETSAWMVVDISLSICAALILLSLANQVRVCGALFRAWGVVAYVSAAEVFVRAELCLARHTPTRSELPLFSLRSELYSIL